VYQGCHQIFELFLNQCDAMISYRKWIGNKLDLFRSTHLAKIEYRWQSRTASNNDFPSALQERGEIAGLSSYVLQ
jgi:hypothetical protein